MPDSERLQEVDYKILISQEYKINHQSVQSGTGS
jgi:hypothetical protein